MLPILAPFCELPCVVGPSQNLVVLKKNCVTNWENSHDVDFYPGESSMKRNEPIIQVETMINMEDLKQLIWFIWKKKFLFCSWILDESSHVMSNWNVLFALVEVSCRSQLQKSSVGALTIS